MGLILAVVVTAADVSDRAGARLLAGQLQGCFPRLVKLFADAGYRGDWLAQGLRAMGGWVLEIVRRQASEEGFTVQPKRWIVERTFGWLNQYRRLSKDYEELPETSEVMILIAMTQLMVRRLTR